ncbi:MAG: hypothetical protein LBJ61_08970 [Deltaproteobacteria bacterium]|jgi:hypothetical protein|nr:hypothetical protein [Deltaproteobacteria bacterium]
MKSDIINITDVHTQKKVNSNEHTSEFRPSDSPFTHREDINYHTRGYTPGAKDNTPKPTPPPFKTGSSVWKPTKSGKN